jgi:co-chaperonin GroES (HSP10)
VTLVPKPIGPRVLVKVFDEQEYHGIVLPAGARARHLRGMIVAAGDGWYREMNEDGPTHTPLTVSVGDTVVWDQRDGVRVTLDLAENGEHEEFVVLHMNDVLLVLVDQPAEVPT